MNLFRTKTIHVVVILLATAIGFASMSVANAASSSEASSEAACQSLQILSDESTPCSSGESKVGNIVGLVVRIISIIAGIIAVIMLIVGGLKYITSSGDANSASSAKKTIIYAIVGLVVVASAQLIAQFVLSRASGTRDGQTNGALARSEGELGQKETSLDAALETGDQSKIDTAQHEYDDALESYNSTKNDPEDSGSSGTPSSGTSGQTKVTQDKLKIVTFNTRFDVAVSTTVSDVRRFTATADIVGLQETSNDRRAGAIKSALADCSRCNFDIYAPRNGAANSEYLILWRKDKLKKIDSGNMNAASGNWGWVKEMRVTWVKLQSKATGRSLYVLNAHPPAHVEVGGRYRNGEAERIRAYGLYMDTIAQFIKSRSSKTTPVFVLGDFNVDYRFDKKVKEPNFPYVRMNKVGAKSSYQVLGEPNRGTHFDSDSDGCTEKGSGKNARVIDYVFASSAKGLTFTDQHVSVSTCSDHNPLTVVVNWKK